jgi:hypothetical protein
MIKTNISRQFEQKSIFHKMTAAIFMWLKGHPVEVGARSLVLATTTTPEENGMFRRPYHTEEEYEK